MESREYEHNLITELILLVILYIISYSMLSIVFLHCQLESHPFLSILPLSRYIRAPTSFSSSHVSNFQKYLLILFPSLKLCLSKFCLPGSYSSGPTPCPLVQVMSFCLDFFSLT